MLISYFFLTGMVALIQIGTASVDFVIDIFPIVELVMTQLKDYLEDASVIKYVFAGDNDFLWLKRCFFIDIVGGCDVQFVFQNILRTGLFDICFKQVPMPQRKSWYHKYVGLRSKYTSSDAARALEVTYAQNRMGFAALAELFYPGEVIDKDAQVADFRPRALEDDKYQMLIKYARDDVHVLLRIMMYFKGNVSG